jgi:hypothetical protein
MGSFILFYWGQADVGKTVKDEMDSVGSHRSWGYTMRWTWFTFLTVALLLVSPVTPCWADLEGGLRAYEHHDYQTAFEEFRQLAEHGDSIAQLLSRPPNSA